MSALFLLLGVWRSWMGGGIGKDWPTAKGFTMIQYAALGALTMAAALPHWQLGLVDGFGLLLLARGYGHGPMLQYPLGPKDSDVILRFVGGPGGGTLRWLAYATIRYVGFALPWAGWRWYLDVAWWPPLAGSALIVLTYAIFTRIPGRDLPTFNDPGSEADNMSEVVGWTLLGAVLYASTWL